VDKIIRTRVSKRIQVPFVGEIRGARAKRSRRSSSRAPTKRCRHYAKSLRHLRALYRCVRHGPRATTKGPGFGWRSYARWIAAPRRAGDRRIARACGPRHDLPHRAPKGFAISAGRGLARARTQRVSGLRFADAVEADRWRGDGVAGRNQVSTEGARASAAGRRRQAEIRNYIASLCRRVRCVDHGQRRARLARRFRSVRETLPRIVVSDLMMPRALDGRVGESVGGQSRARRRCRDLVSARAA